MGPDEERYVAPPRSYELPEYRQGHEGTSTSNEPYLRRVRWCNYREPEVVALAHELGAYELSDREYAEAAYWWMKSNMWYEMSGFDGPGGTLRRGLGACLHFNNTYIALCRCAGIKARFKGYKMRFRPIEREVFADVDAEMASMWAARRRRNSGSRDRSMHRWHVGDSLLAADRHINGSDRVAHSRVRRILPRDVLPGASGVDRALRVDLLRHGNRRRS